MRNSDPLLNTNQCLKLLTLILALIALGMACGYLN